MTRAAELLHITQPTLSKQLKALEDELGKKLFTRHSFSIQLTEEGILLRKRAEDLVKMADKGPFGAVKEQAAGLYAQTMAERGFLTMAFDPSFTGESGGIIIVIICHIERCILRKRINHTAAQRIAAIFVINEPLSVHS
mgnify:CR=1 FL=1